MYEEVEPGRILDERTAADGEGKEYLVQYKVRIANQGIPALVAGKCFGLCNTTGTALCKTMNLPDSQQPSPVTPSALCYLFCVVQDDTPDEWVRGSLIASDLLEDWSKGLERAPVAALLDVQQWGTSREYLVQWADGSPVSCMHMATLLQLHMMQTYSAATCA